MDNTLRAILSELFAVSVELDRLREHVAELEKEIVRLGTSNK